MRPRLSLSAVAAVGFLAMVALPRPAIPLIDGDVWWHIRAGEEVLRAGRIPAVDTWSIAGAGMPWTSQDWLSNVALALGHRLGSWGPTVLSLLFSLHVVVSLLVLWRGIAIRERSIGWLAPIVWLAVGLTVAGPVVGVRVQVVDLPLAAATLVVLWRYLADRRVAVLAWLPLIALAWANLHAGWLLLFLLGGAVVVGEAVDRLAGRRLDPEPLAWRQNAWAAGALVIALAAIAINPNGPALYLYPIETAGIAAHRDFLAEWSPPDVATLTGQLFAGFVLLGVLPALALGWRRMRAADVLVLLGLTIMAATAARFLLVAGPIGAAVIAIHLAPRLSATRLGRTTSATLRRMERPPTAPQAAINLGLAAVLVVLGLALAMARVAPEAQRAAIDEHMPVAAVDWLIANDPGDRPFNTYSWGGYLGLQRPATLVYIDGRSDIYGDAPIREYANAISLRTDPGRLLDAQRIDHVLFNTDHPFARRLDDAPGWERVHEDPLASVWVRRTE